MPPLAGYGSFGEFGDAEGVMCLRGFVCLVAICHLDLVWERETWTARLGPPVVFYTPKEIGGLDMLSIGRAVLIPQFDLGCRRHRNNSCALQPLRAASVTEVKTRGVKPRLQELRRCGTHLCVALYLACYSTHVPPHEHTHTSHMDSHRMVGHTHTHDSCNTWAWTCTNPLPPTAYALKQSAYPESLRSVEAPQQQQPSQRPAAGLLQAHDGARARRTRRYALTLVGYW